MWKRHRWWIFVAMMVAGAAVLLSPGPAAAQIRYLPASEYNRINIHAPQAIVSTYDEMSRRNVFERLQNFRSSNRYREAGRPIGRLKVRVRDDSGRQGVALCTASIISPQYLLTNHHCLPGEVGLRLLGAKVEFDYIDAKHPALVRSYAVDLKPVETNDELDYSILRVHGDPAAQFGTVTFSKAPPEVQDSIFIIGYPEGQPETLSRKDCYIRAVKAEEFTHSCDTLPGSSGSPVFLDNTFRMVGLHYAGGQEGNFAKNMDDLVHHSRILESIAVTERPASQPAVQEAPTRPTLTLALNSEPQGAAIFYGKTLLGLTPLTFAVAPKGHYIFRLRKSGYADAAIAVDGKQGTVERTVELSPSVASATTGQMGTQARTPTGRFDRADAQARAARAFWEKLDKSGWLGGSTQTPAKSHARYSPQQNEASEQARNANRFLNSFGRRPSN